MKHKEKKDYFYTFKGNISQMLYKSIRMLVFILLLMSLLYSIQSDIFHLDNLSFKFIWVLIFSIICIFLLLVFSKKKLYGSLLLFLRSHGKLLFWSFFIFCIIYQIFLICNLKATPSYDAALLTTNIENKPLVSEYLSINSNNRLLYFINLGYMRIFGFSIIRLQIFNFLIITTSVLVFLKITTKLFNQSIGFLATFCLMVFSIIQPLYLIPYTDTYCLLPMFLSINFLINCSTSKKNSHIIIFSALSAFFLCIAYLIRPSCIIFIIATFLFLLINIQNKRLQKHIVKSVPIFILTSLIVLSGFNVFTNNQKIIGIDRSKEIPFAHFLLLGSFGNEDDHLALHGTWNSKDINTTYSGKTKKDKSNLDLNSLKKRTMDRGVSRTVKLYWQKYIQNTDSGVIGYHRDGLWITSVYSSKGSFRNKIQQIYYEDGKLRPTFNFVCQIFWLFTLSACLVALYTNKSWKIALIALNLFGGLLFLEIFESGGTKYLFQYIPLICLLAGVGMHFFFNKLTILTNKQ